MRVLGLQGSPRKKGNTCYLLTRFLEECQKQGADIQVVDVCRKKIEPCMEYILCEKKGICPIDDDMKREIYSMLRRADVIVAATPIFFYNTTAQLKALIDRTQTLWARKYKLMLTDPNRLWRKGFTLAVGATRGKNLFEGLNLTMKYFYDAVGASNVGSLTYRQIEKPGDMERLPSLQQDIETAVTTLLLPFQGRKTVLFADAAGSCLAQMACAFTQLIAGDRMDAVCAGFQPSDCLEPVMVQAMEEKGIDMGFREPLSIKDALSGKTPEIAIAVGDVPHHDVLSGNLRFDMWDFQASKDIHQMRQIRDAIEARVKVFIQQSA